MKKIISLLCVVAMIFSFATFNVCAADNEFKLVIEDQTETTVTIGAYLNTTYDLKSFTFYVDSADATAKNAGTISFVNAAANIAPKAVTAQKMFQVSYIDAVNGTTITGSQKLVEITVDTTNVAEAFALSRKADAGRVKFDVVAVDPSTGGTMNVTSQFDLSGLALTVAPAQPEPEEEKVVMTAAPFITEVATSEEKDGWQAGQAVALQFATADLADFIAMNWKLTVADVNKFAKVDDAAFATIKATAAETVDVFASFIVNTAENKTATPITAVSAGFLKADGTVVEAE